jgi:NADPH2:quinone reductase
MMKYVEITEPGAPAVLQTAQRAVPECAADEVLVQVCAAGINRPDVMQRKGLYPPPPEASEIPGLEVAGVIVAVGSRVSRWSTGDRVCALVNGGGYAEYVNVPAGQCLPVPAACSMTEAASLPETFFTVWSNVFDGARLQPGESLLVHGGTSGIGVAAIQMATVLGSRVFVTAGTAKKCQACRELGAEHAVNYKTSDFVQELNAATAGDGVDVILDMVGGDYIGRDFQLAAEDGRIVSIAFQSGARAEVDLLPVLLKRLSYTGSTLRPRSAAEKAHIADALRANIWPHIDNGKIKAVVAKTFPLENAAEAHAYMEQGDYIGKIVLIVNDDPG